MSISAITSPSAGATWNKVMDATAATQAAGKGTGKVGKDSPAEIKRAATQFEAIILRQLLTPTIEPIMNGGLGGTGSSGGGGVYSYMLTDVLADSLSKGGGLGLTQMLSRQLTPRGLPPAVENGAAAVSADAEKS